MRLLWLPNVLRSVGLDVIELPGWETRGRMLDTVYGVVVHDTVTTDSWTDESVDALITNGKPGTPGPLYQLTVDRLGRFRVIASGKANHAGYSRIWKNQSIGISAYCAGGLKDHEEPWNDKQYDSIVLGTRAILDHLSLSPSSHFNPRVAGHKEIDTRGKIDPYTIDMDQFRSDVAQTTSHPVTVPPKERTVTAKRIGGGTRHETAVLLARTRWQDEKGGLAFLVNPSSFDSAAVANVASMGRIFTVDRDRISPDTLRELGRVKPDEVIAVGLQNAISDKVLEAARKAAQ